MARINILVSFNSQYTPLRSAFDSRVTPSLRNKSNIMAKMVVQDTVNWLNALLADSDSSNTLIILAVVPGTTNIEYKHLKLTFGVYY